MTPRTFTNVRFNSLGVYSTIGLMLMILLCTSCLHPIDVLGTPSRVSPDDQIASYVPPTSMPTKDKNITDTISPTISTSTPTILPVQTIKSPQFFTPIIGTPLSIEAARNTLIDLLSNNGSCSLPCIWGITPGKSTFEEAKSILLPLSNISFDTTFQNGNGKLTPEIKEEDLTIYINWDFISKSNVVSQVYFRGRALNERKGEGGIDDVFDSNEFGNKLNYYMLPQILSRYGQPSSIQLSTLAGVPNPESDPDVNFNILMLYPEHGFLVHYVTEMRKESEIIIGCPTNAHVELELFPSGSAESFFKALSLSYWPAIIKNNYKPLEEVTSMSIDDFYQIYKSPNTNKCIETPAEFWPSPER